MRYFIFSILALSMISLYGQKATVKAEISKESPTGSAITRETVEQFYNKIVTELTDNQSSFSKQSYLNYNLFSFQLNKWMNYQFLELDSGIDREWFKKVNEFLVFFYNTKKGYDRSVEAETSEAKVTAKKRFDAGVNNFKKFLEKEPPKPKAERLEVLKRQKQEYERAKRIKEKTQGKAKGGEDGKQKLFDE